MSSKKIFHANNIEIFDTKFKDTYPYIVRKTQDNGIRGYIKENEEFLNSENTLTFAQDTFTVFYQKEKYFTGNKVKVLKPRIDNFNEDVATFIVAICNFTLRNFSWGIGSDVKMINSLEIKLPTKNGEIDFKFMESFVAELEARHVAELEAYLTITGLKDYELTEAEKEAISNYHKVVWSSYNLKELFGKATRGKRLKSADRIEGTLPFVTAGETNEGISAFIGNKVEIFKKNTVTIDMFGSAKYRNYDYGGDDHIAVVHTEKLPMMAAIFVTTAIHKTSYNGQFNYGRNFYAKDADILNIRLPGKQNKPDFEYMETLISAIQKLVIRDVVIYANKKEKATQIVLGNR